MDATPLCKKVDWAVLEWCDVMKINLQSLEDTQVEYILQKYTWYKYTLEKYTLEKFQMLGIF